LLELSPLAARHLDDGPVPSAAIVTGTGRVEDAECVLVANEATVKVAPTAATAGWSRTDRRKVGS
jgi:acetyl-CoA carboxylase carboxyltransferase component